MADLQIAGATYSAVPSILIPKVGGGEAQFYDMSGDISWMGAGAEFVKNIYSKTDTLYNTSFHGWTPSTTAKAIVATATAGTFVANTADYDYYIVWDCGVDPEYTGTPTLKAHTIFSRCYMVQQITKRPSSWANIEADVFNGNACASVYTSTFLRYYGTTTGSITYSWSASYGFYFGATAATFSSSTSNAPTVTVKTPTISVRCSTTYFSTGNAALVDQENSEWFIIGKIYRAKPGGILRGIYEKTVDLINEREA